MMAGDIENVLIETASVMVMYDSNKSNNIEFLLPSDKMAKIKLVTQQQQIEINKSIKCYTGDKNYIDWSMVGIDDAFDIMDALEKYQKQENMYFNKIDMHKCHIDLWDEKIVFQLDARQMKNLNSEWEHAIARELEKNHVFHPFESVIINRAHKNKKKATVNKNKIIHTNTNKIQKKNTNQNKTENKQKQKEKNRNENTTIVNKNDENKKRINTNNLNSGVNVVSTDSIDEILDGLDMECKNINNELEKRELDTCKYLDDSFDIVIEIENMRLKLERNTFKVSYKKNEYNSKQMQRDGDFDMDLKRYVLNVKNKIEVIEENLLNEKIKTDERNEINERRIKEFEMVVEKVNGFVLALEKQERQLNMTEKNKKIQQTLCECDDLINENVNYKLTMDERLYKLNVMYNSITIMNDKLRGVSEKISGAESSMYSQKQKQQRKKNNCNNVQGYEKILSGTKHNDSKISETITGDDVFNEMTRKSSNLNHLTSILSEIIINIDTYTDLNSNILYLLGKQSVATHNPNNFNGNGLLMINLESIDTVNINRQNTIDIFNGCTNLNGSDCITNMNGSSTSKTSSLSCNITNENKFYDDNG